jgi:hypothetical protein
MRNRVVCQANKTTENKRVKVIFSGLQLETLNGRRVFGIMTSGRN